MNCKEFLEQIITHLTGETPNIVVEEDSTGAVILIDVSGRVSSLIGRNGVTIDAVRTLVKAIGIDGKHRIKIRLNEAIAR